MNAATQMYPTSRHAKSGRSHPAPSRFSTPCQRRYNEIADCSTSSPKACVTKKRKTPSSDTGIPLDTPATVCSAPENAKLNITVRAPTTTLSRGSCATSCTTADEMFDSGLRSNWCQNCLCRPRISMYHAFSSTQTNSPLQFLQTIRISHRAECRAPTTDVRQPEPDC
jgi:hypothetical protein